MKWLIALCVASLLWGGWATYHAQRSDTTRDSVLAVSAFKDSVALESARAADSHLTASAAALSASRLLQRRSDGAWALLRRAPPVSPPDTTLADTARWLRQSLQGTSDSLHVALGTLDLLRGSLDSLKVAFQAQREAADRFRLAFTQEKSRGDGLAESLRKQPRGCAKVLGVPVPRIGVGYGITAHGLGPVVALVVPLSGC